MGGAPEVRKLFTLHLIFICQGFFRGGLVVSGKLYHIKYDVRLFHKNTLRGKVPQVPGPDIKSGTKL